AVLDRREVPFDVNVYVGRARVNHRIALVDRHRLALENFSADGGLENSQINRLPLAEFSEIEFLQPIFEPLQTRKLRVEREPAVIRNLAVVFVQSFGSAEQWTGGEVTLDELLGQRFVFRIRRLQGKKIRRWQTERRTKERAA